LDERLVAGGAMALAIGATGVMVTSPAHADEVKKPAVTAPAPVLCSEKCNKAIQLGCQYVLH
jgi:Amt family ammonium transporter